MDRRRILAALVLAPFASRTRAEARPKRIVYVPTAGFARMARRDRGMGERLLKWMGEEFAAMGLVPGRDVALEYVDLELTDLDRNGIERRAKAMLSSKPDLVLVGEDGIEPLMRLTREIPLVFYEFSGDPVAMGLVKSFNRPGGNVTGTTLTAPDAIAKGWQMLRDLAPKAKRLGVMWRKEDLDDPWAIMDQGRQKTLATQLGFECVPVIYSQTRVLDPIERAIRAAHVDALDASAELEDPWKKDLMRFVERQRLPTIWPTYTHVREGGLLAVHGSFGESKRDALDMVARIVRGAKPGDIPVAFPTKIITAINMKTAQAMGLAVPESVLLRATMVVR
jgi:putative ABC transport system substrate-binding protein